MNWRDDYLEQRLTDAAIEHANGEHDVRLNRVEADVLVALRVGAKTKVDAAQVTGYTTGQVQHALGVLQTQGLIEDLS